MKIRVFGLNGSGPYAKTVAHYLDLPLAEHIQKHFDDHEHYLKSVKNVRNCDVYVIDNLCSNQEQSVNENFVNLAMFIGSLKDASAKRITVVAPYLAYSRQDRKDSSRAPISTKYVAQMLESVGANRLITMDVHNKSALDNAYRIPTDNLEWKKLLVDYLCGGLDKDGRKIKTHVDNPLSENPKDLAILSPDIGGMERAEQVRLLLEDRLGVNIEPAIFNKRRINGTATGKRIIGDVKGKRVILIDDLIASGGTVKLATDTVETHGGKMFAVCAPFGLFTLNHNDSSKDAVANLSALRRIIVSDVIPTDHLPDKFTSKLQFVETAGMVAKAIRITNESGSISRLLS